MKLSDRSNQLNLIIGFTLLILCGALQMLIQRTPALSAPSLSLPTEYIGLSIDPKIVRRLLGTRLLVADLVWIDTLMKADISKEKESYSSFYRAAKTIVTLDPDNIYAYYVFGMYLSVIKDDIKGASTILRDGAEYIDQMKIENELAWRVQFTLGYHLMFEEQEFDEGSRWIQKAGAAPGVPDFIKSLAEHVSTEQGKLEVASRVLTDLYHRVNKPEEKEKIEAKLLDLSFKQELLDLNFQFQTYLQATGAYALSRERAFDMFMRSISRRKTDQLGHKLYVNALGRIEAIK